MSHFTRIKTSIRDLATLQSVLTQLDVSWEKAIENYIIKSGNIKSRSFLANIFWRKELCKSFKVQKFKKQKKITL